VPTPSSSSAKVRYGAPYLSFAISVATGSVGWKPVLRRHASGRPGLRRKRSLPASIETTRGAAVNHADKRFGERGRLIRFGDAQVRSSKVAKNRYVRRISFERPPYGQDDGVSGGGVDDQQPVMLPLAKICLSAPSWASKLRSSSSSAEEGKSIALSRA
jgi:hypothetical protein